MANELAVGSVLRHHVEDGYVDLGKVVWVESAKPGLDPARLRFWYIEFSAAVATKSGKRRRFYIKTPALGYVAEAISRIEEGSLSLIQEKRKSTHFLTNDQLDGTIKAQDLTRPTRRKLARWKAKRDLEYGLISPILERDDHGKLLEEGRLDQVCSHHALEVLKHATADKVNHAIRRYMLNGQDKNACMPCWDFNGQPGSRKFCATKTGCPNKNDLPSFNVGPLSSKQLRAGYKKHRTNKATDYGAYILTMKEYWAESIQWITPTEAKIVLLPPHLRPTQAEFARHGKIGDPTAQSERIDLGERRWSELSAPSRGNFRTGIPAVGLIGVLDATSEDQRPVSRASRLLQLPSSWRTMIVDGRLNYIFGVHRGFEHGGTIAGLKAVLHAAEPKVQWAAARGFHLSPRDWYSTVFKRVRGDNGDLKSEAGMTAMTLAQVSLEITRSYAAAHKIVESTHKTMHRTADHLMAASTRGKLTERGGAKPEETCVNFDEGWQPLIRAILRHNNEVLVPQYLTQEMRQHGVRATRQCMLEFDIEHGYVSTEPADLSYLRAQCLPTFEGRFTPDGIQVMDPRDHRRYVPSLVYWGECLAATSLTNRGNSVQSCAIQLDPSEIGQAWVLIAGEFRRLCLRSDDPEMATLTLADWLFISDQDVLNKFLARGALHSSDASRLASNAAINAHALQQKRMEERALGKVAGAKSTRGTKRQNLVTEVEIQRQTDLGLAPLGARQISQSVQALVEDCAWDIPEQDESDERMASLRRRRSQTANESSS